MAQPTKQQNISFYEAIAISLGAIIGWGAYVMPGDLFLNAKLYGSSAAILIGTFLIILIAKPYINLSSIESDRRLGSIGWIATHLNRTHALIYSWCILAGYIAIIALNISAITLLMRYFLPASWQTGYLYTISGWDVYASEAAVCMTIVCLFSYTNYKGLRAGAKTQLYIALLMVLSLFALLAASLYATPNHILPSASLETNHTVSENGSWLAVLAVMPWAYIGFETTPQLSKVISRSKTQTKFIILFSIAAGCFFYLAINYLTALNLNFDYATIAHSPWATGEGISRIAGTWGMAILATAMMCSILSGINGFMLATGKLFESMHDLGVLPAWLTAPDRRFSQKRTGLLILILCLFAPWLGRNHLSDMVNTASFGIAIGFFYVAFADLVRLRKNTQHPISAYLAVMTSIVFIVLLLMPDALDHLSMSGIGIIITILGLCFAYLALRSRRISC